MYNYITYFGSFSDIIIYLRILVPNKKILRISKGTYFSYTRDVYVEFHITNTFIV